MSATASALALLASLLLVPALPAQVPPPPGEGPALKPPRVTQAEIAGGQLTLRQIRLHGLRIFATPFNQHDGFGDGPMDPADPISPGGRPTLQGSTGGGNGSFLRVNGLDSQSCLECHGILSTATVPFRMGVGGAGTANNNAMSKPSQIDVTASQGGTFASFDGRFINPPFVLGSGGVELLAKEMTAELQQLKQLAQQQPGTDVPLVTKGVDFGIIRYVNGSFDTSGVEGVDPDLVVRPFGRKGEFATTRAFDVEALPFHHGMQPVETVGQGVDDDGDGVTDEILVGELSALSIFNTTLERPVQESGSPHAAAGEQVFTGIGCADCHRPFLDAQSAELTFSFPEVETDPSANVFYSVDLRRAPARFPAAPGGGIRVPLFSDLKRHDMGPGLAENTGSALDSWYVTARLWGIADTGPYLHDGRAMTLTEAILLHGGEAQGSRDQFAALSAQDRERLLGFLRTLRTPERSAVGLSLPPSMR